MPLWGNTDANTAKPRFSELRQVRPSATATAANTGVLAGAAAGNTVITVANGTGTIVIGQFVFGGNVSQINSSGESEFFKGNNSVLSVVGGNFGTSNVVLRSSVTALLTNGTPLNFGTEITYNSDVANTFFSDTILVTPTRPANTSGTTGRAGSTVANTKIGSINTGWNRIVRKINNDGTIRFLKETLIALANPVAANASSANTSSNAIFGGL
jgi:hypothetical protein